MAGGYEVNAVRLWLVIDQVNVTLPAALRFLANTGSGLDAFTQVTANLGTQAAVNRPVLDVGRFSMGGFAPNTIPQAAATIALGRLANNPAIVSEVHELRDFLTQRLRVSVYAQVTPLLNSDGRGKPSPWTGNAFRLFDGYTAGVGYRRTPDGAELVLALTHWLDDLTRSSAVSSLTMPQNPAALAFPAMMRFLGRPGSPAPAAVNVGQTMARLLVTRNAVQNDFWALNDREGVLPWLLSLTELEALNYVPTLANLSRDPGFTPDVSNAQARAALQRFETTAYRAANPNTSQSVPLAFRMGDVAAAGDYAPRLVNNIADTVASRSIQQLFGVTLWDVLLALSADFGFAVIPMVEKALVVPFVKGLRSTWRSIAADQNSYMQHHRGPTRTVRAAAVYAGTSLFCGTGPVAGATSAAPPSINGVGGFYQGDSLGQIVWFDAPRWMYTPALLQPSAALTLGGVAGAANPGQVMNAAQLTALLGGPVGSGPAAGPTAVSLFGPVLQQLQAGQQNLGKVPGAFQTARNAMDRLARLLYVNEVLAHRRMDLSGPLRLDIGPGSSVRVEGVGDAFIPGIDQLAGDLYATVLQTSVALDANPQRPTAMTSFHLSHVRSSTENARDASSIDAHPFWQQNWTGCPLVEAT